MPQELRVRSTPASASSCGRRGSDATAWDAFVEGCPHATFFHRFGWRQIIDDVFRHRSHYLVAEVRGSIAGILPLAQVKSRMFGHSLASLPFCVYGGPAADDAEAELALIDEATRLARTLDVEYLELRNRAVNARHGPPRTSTSRFGGNSFRRPTPTCWPFRASSAR